MRDDFSDNIKTTISDRVSKKCSNPDCKAPTSGPQVDPTKTLNVGVAAHITAASPGGARFDSSFKSEERRNINNAIWLCQTCAKLIDNDADRFPVKLIREWKRDAETEALNQIGKTKSLSNVTDNKPSQFIDFTEYYNVPEIAQKLGVSDDRIYQWGMTGKLILSFIYHKPADYREIRYEKDAQGKDVRITRIHQTIFNMSSEENQDLEIFYLYPEDAKRIILNKVKGREVLISDLYFTSDLEPQKARKLWNCPISVRKDELIVTQKEFQRFVAENKLTAT